MKTTLTADQLEAIDFYSLNQQSVEYFGLGTVLDSREDRLLFKKGRQLIEGAISAAKKAS